MRGVDGVLSGDEIVEVNGTRLTQLTHGEAVAVFKRIRRGRAHLLVRRRTQHRITADSSRSVTDSIREPSPSGGDCTAIS